MSATTPWPVPVITGPTAAGKTGLAVALAARHPDVSLISADSVMVYRGLDIGSGKPDAETLARHPHALVDIRDPASLYSAAEFARDAAALIEEAWAADRIPLLVGGTMLYLRALMDGLSALPSAHVALRDRLRREAERLGWPALHARLAAADPATGGRIHPNDAQRIQRALEILEITGERPSELFARERRPIRFKFHPYVLVPRSRALLHERIAVRFQGMLDAGLVEEVAALSRRDDLSEDLPAIRAVGYRQVWEYLAGRYDRATMVDRGLAATRQLAKRQMTWLKGDRRGNWFDVDDPGTLGAVLNSVVRDLKL